jgi:hypothetical protein
MRYLIVILALLCSAALTSGCSTPCEAYCDKIDECGKPGGEACRIQCDELPAEDCEPFFDCVASKSCGELDDGGCDAFKKCGGK